MDVFLFSFNGVAPICLMVILGMLLRKIKILSRQTAEAVNKLCFQVFIPIKIFSQIYQSDLTCAVDWTTLIYSLAATAAVLAGLCFFAPRFIKKRTHCGEFIQGVFRSNSAILGIPLIINLYGEQAGAALALVLPLMLIFYNSASPIVLARFSDGEKADGRKIARKVASNPFLIAALLGLTFALLGMRCPVFLQNTLNSLGAVGSPLALLALGAVTGMEDFKACGKPALLGSVLRMAVIPLFVLTLGILLGIRGEQMAVLVCFFCTPTAVGGYVLAKNIDGDGELAGQILLQTTLLSFVTMFGFVLALRALGVM